MTAFLIIASLLALLAAAAMAWPLLRPRAVEGQAASAAPLVATLAAATIGLGSFAIYFGLSDWDWDAPAEHAASAGQMDFAEVVQRLEERLAQQPGDSEGWKMLGRTRSVLGEFELAQRAYARALELTNNEDPEAMVGFAEALAMTDESSIDGKAGDLFERALSLRPDDARALWYGGIVAYRRGSFELARDRWLRLQAQSPPEQLRALLQERIAELDGRLGARSAEASTTPPAATGINVEVNLTPALAASSSGDATLFIIARRGTAGPPLAVIRRRASEIPLAVTLSDADAMLPGMTLTTGGPLNLIARISKSGQPTPASGDLFGEVGYDFASTGPVILTISQVVP